MSSKRKKMLDACWEQSLLRRLANLPGKLDSKQAPPSTPLKIPLEPLVCGNSAPPSNGHRVDPTITSEQLVEVSGLRLRIRGNSVLCLCPDCRSPMALRLWLMTADCWRCQASIELSESQLHALREWIPTPRAPAPLPGQRTAPPPGPAAFPLHVEPTRIGRPAVISDAERELVELEDLLQGTRWGRLVKQMLASLPAWLISFLLHLFLILVLAMIMLTQHQNETIQLILSTFIDSRRQEGGEVRIEDPLLAMEDDSLPASPTFEELQTNEAMQEAADAAAELLIDPAPLAPLPDLADVRNRLAQPRQSSATFLARDPRVRAEIVEREGGTTLSEAAVARGLRWLASVQNRDGSWSLANYERHARADNEGDAAATSLALLPFLGAGQTHEFGIYKRTVARGLDWLLAHQKSNGDLRANFERPAGMYAHGQAAIVLCEIYAMTGDERFREPAQRAIEFIEAAQHRQGGWRYEPGQSGDTSVFGWQMMALQSARASAGNLKVSPDVLQMADYYLDLASSSRRGSQGPDGALYRYLPREGNPTASMTAEAILCRMYLGWERDDPRLMFAVRWLLENHLPGAASPDIYYWYYGTQAMHHYGGQAWKIWNAAFRDLLVSMQLREGKHPGSWNPKEFRWGAEGERIFVTSMAVCTLEVYYRHLPLFQPLEFDDARRP